MRFEIASLPRSCSSPARRSVADVVGVEVQPLAQADGDLGDALGVAAGVGRLRVDDAGERLGDAVQAVVVGHEHAVGGLDLGDGGAVERGPEVGVVLDAGKRVDERRVEPGAAPAAGDPECAVAAAVLPEDLHRLREAEDPPGQRDRLAGEAGRAPAAVPVLVEVADRRVRRSRRGRSSARCPHRARSATRTSPASRAARRRRPSSAASRARAARRPRRRGAPRGRGSPSRSCGRSACARAGRRGRRRRRARRSSRRSSSSPRP